MTQIWEENLYDKTTAYNDMSDSYRKEIEKGVTLLVTESENIRNHIVKNEYMLDQMSRKIS